MRIQIFLLILLLIFSSGCINTKILTDSSPVLNLNLAIKGNYSNPLIDTENTTRSGEIAPMIKQHRYDEIVDLPHISCEVFYKQDKISYFTSKPYKGVGEYEFTIVFKDNKLIPNSSDETTTVLIRIVGSDGKYIAKEYIIVRWP